MVFSYVETLARDTVVSDDTACKRRTASCTMAAWSSADSRIRTTAVVRAAGGETCGNTATETGGATC
jgi:hypothetical protein